MDGRGLDPSGNKAHQTLTGQLDIWTLAGHLARFWPHQGASIKRFRWAHVWCLFLESFSWRDTDWNVHRCSDVTRVCHWVWPVASPGQGGGGGQAPGSGGWGGDGRVTVASLFPVSRFSYENYLWVAPVHMSRPLLPLTFFESCPQSWPKTHVKSTKHLFLHLTWPLGHSRHGWPSSSPHTHLPSPLTPESTQALTPPDA